MVLCALDQALCQNAGAKSADGFTSCYWPVAGCVFGISILEDRGDQGGLPGLRHLTGAESRIEQHQQARC